MQRSDSHLAHDLGELLHEALTNAALLSVGFHTDCVEHGGGVLMTELAAQDAGDGKAAQGAAPHHADLDEVVRAEFRRRHALLEEMPPGMADVGAVDGNYPLKIVDRELANRALASIGSCEHRSASRVFFDVFQVE